MNLEKQTEIILRENGPLKITGSFTIQDTDGETMQTGETVFICRCGASKKMPFCDGAHKKTGVKK